MPTSEATAPVSAGRVLVAGVGYQNLRDLSAGLHVLERLEQLEQLGQLGQLGQQDGLGERVDLEDLSYGPIDVLFLLQRRARYAAAVFVTGSKRGRAPGSVDCRRGDPPPITPDALQDRVVEGVTGVISLDNLLYICGHFGALPPEVIVVEVEPADEGWGEGVSEAGGRAVDQATALVRAEVVRLLSA